MSYNSHLVNHNWALIKKKTEGTRFFFFPGAFRRNKFALCQKRELLLIRFSPCFVFRLFNSNLIGSILSSIFQPVIALLCMYDSLSISVLSRIDLSLSSIIANIWIWVSCRFGSVVLYVYPPITICWKRTRKEKSNLNLICFSNGCSCASRGT